MTFWELGPVSDVRDWLDRLAAGLPRQDHGRHRSRLQALTPTVFESHLPAQAIHGDASISNLLRTDRGLLWNDLEDVCIGPVHWDVAGLVLDARTRGADEAFVADLLDAYGRPDLEALDDFIAAHLLYTTIWRAHRMSAAVPAAASPVR
jgi:Ser/Thr protein kinase RdoA (MazF antagonist)